MLNKGPDKKLEIIIFCSGFVLFLVLLQAFLGRSVIRYSNRLKSEFKEKQVKLKESEDLIKGMPNPQKAIEDVEKKIQEFKDMGVSRKQIPRIIQLLGKSIAEHNINIISIKPREDIKYGNENLPAGVTKVYIEMVISSPYQSLGEYMKVLSELPVSFSIESITLEKKQGGPEYSEAKKAVEKIEEKKTEKEELLCTLILSTYMVWEI